MPPSTPAFLPSPALLSRPPLFSSITSTRPPLHRPSPALPAPAHSNSPRISPRACAAPTRPRLSSVQVVAERFSDTISDAGVHFSRLIGLQKSVGSAGPRVVVLGSGWAAHSFVKVVDMTAVASVTVVSPRNFFFFTPLLSASSVGTVEFRSIVEPLRIAQPAADFFEAFAYDVDTRAQLVRCLPGKREGKAVDGAEAFDVPYDILVVACGETTSTFGVAGARQYACFMKEIGDARNLRLKMLDALEKASLPVWTDKERRQILSFVVVGGGPTGCEFAGELSDFVEKDLVPTYGESFAKLVSVTLLQSSDSLLTQFEGSLQAMAIDNFEDRVKVVFNARVVEVTADEVLLKDGRRFPHGLLVWAAGNGTRPLVGKLISKVSADTPEEAVKRRGKLVVDPWLRVKGMPNVMAFGDCAIIEDDPLPATAQVAGQQGAFAARLISKARSIGGIEQPVLREGEGRRELHPFRFLSLGIMAYIGNSKAIVQVDTSEKSKIRVGGGIAYLLWQSVYAVKQVDTRSRVLVILDQLKAKLWGRDLSQF